jgi:hypothetical protein
MAKAAPTASINAFASLAEDIGSLLIQLPATV